MVSQGGRTSVLGAGRRSTEEFALTLDGTPHLLVGGATPAYCAAATLYYAYSLYIPTMARSSLCSLAYSHWHTVMGMPSLAYSHYWHACLICFLSFCPHLSFISPLFHCYVGILPNSLLITFESLVQVKLVHFCKTVSLSPTPHMLSEHKERL